MSRWLHLLLAVLATPTVALAQQPDPPEDEVAKVDAAGEDRRASSGLGLNLRVGATATKRDLNLAGTDLTVEHRPGIYLGGAVGATLDLFTLSPHSALAVDLIGEFGSAADTTLRPNRRPLTTEHVAVTARALYEQTLRDALTLRLGLGFSGESYTIERNALYTGHRYLALLVSIEATYWLFHNVSASAEVTFLPSIDTNNSGGGYGAARAFGGRGTLSALWRFFQPTPGDLFGTAEIVASYALTRYQTSLPESQAFGDFSHTADTAHALSVGVAYNL